MTDNEVRKQMEFILNQQAQTAVNIQTLSESQTQVEQRVSRMEGAFVGLVNIIGDTQKVTQAKLAELAEAQKRTDAALAETNERLNSFISFVERYLSNRQNGQTQN